ncbi:TPA: recombination protein NinG [Pseudomonas aeruginosa]
MSLSASQLKPKKCQNPACGQEFTPRFSSTQKVCSPACALAIKDKHAKPARKAIDDRKRREVRVRKEKLKSRSDHLREAQAVINRYVRLRDDHLGCVSCDKPATWGGQWHCSHFRSVGAAPQLRFNLWNMNKSCSACNNHLSGNLMAYRPRLIEKIGQAKVDRLESDNSVARHDIPYLKRLKAVFSKKIRRLEARRKCSAA